MEELAGTILENTSLLARELVENGHPAPSLGKECPIFFPFLSVEAMMARAKLIQAAEDLILLASGPYDSFLNLSSKVMGMGTLRALLNHRILQLIPLDGSVSFAELSAAVGVAEPILVRLIRFAICCGYLAEEKPGLVGHNALSSMILRDSNVGAGIMHAINVHYPSSVKIFESTKIDPTGSKEDHTAFSVAFSEQGQPLPSFWTYSRARPDMTKEFHNLMAASASSSLWSFQHVVNGYDWSQINHLVDVGGSTGHMSMAIADKYPQLEFDVQDLEEVIEPSRIKLPAKYTGKITFTSHDFFQVQPIVADSYLYRCVFHNWGDEDARKIIASLVPALRPGSRVIIADHVIPEHGEAPISVTKTVRNLDILMLSLLATKERSKKEFVDLMSGADRRLCLESFHSLSGSAIHILVFRFVE